MQDDDLLTLDCFIKNKEALWKFETTTAINLKDLWMEKGDVNYDEAYLTQEKLPYKQMDPLYMKMIHRLRSCQGRIAQFYHQIDPVKQLDVLRLLPRFEPRNYAKHQIITFFAWISNMKGAADIQELVDKHKFEKNAIVEWWSKTPISFFLNLPESAQNELIAEYNEKEIIRKNAWREAELSSWLGDQITEISTVNVEDDFTASDSEE